MTMTMMKTHINSITIAFLKEWIWIANWIWIAIIMPVWIFLAPSFLESRFSWSRNKEPMFLGYNVGVQLLMRYLICTLWNQNCLFDSRYNGKKYEPSIFIKEKKKLELIYQFIYLNFTFSPLLLTESIYKLDLVI